MGLIAPVLIGIVLFYWFALCFTVYAWPSAILCLCKNQYIRASLWFSAGLHMIVWWDGRYSWDEFLSLYITLVGAGAIASAWRHSKRMSRTAAPVWTPPSPPPDATNVVPFVRLHVSGAARRRSDRSG
jgi:hypothetical protein